MFGNTTNIVNDLSIILTGFGDNVVENYKNSMPNATIIVSSSVTEVLDEILTITNNQRIVDQARDRYERFASDAQKSIDSSVKSISKALNELKSSSVEV